MKGLQGKVAIVTGGATIIGAAVVEVLRGFGARVAVFDIDAAGGDRAVARDPVATRFWKVDITDDEQVAQGVASVAEHFGRVDHLVNLACSYTDKGAESPRSDWQSALNVNVVSAVMMARAVRPAMVAAGWSRVSTRVQILMLCGSWLALPAISWLRTRSRPSTIRRVRLRRTWPRPHGRGHVAVPGPAPQAGQDPSYSPPYR